MRPVPRRASGMRVLGGSSGVLLLGPAGLADGLAPDSRRYGPEERHPRPDSPPEAPTGLPNWFPRSPRPWAVGTRRSCYWRRQYDTPPGGFGTIPDRSEQRPPSRARRAPLTSDAAPRAR